MNILDKIVAHKKQEIAKLPKLLKSTKFKYQTESRDFLKTLCGKEQISLIAEIKRRSPSNPQIFRGNFNPAQITRAYEQAGVSAISVLTDQEFFGGSFEYLNEAKHATDLPILAKDFFISQLQIDLAKKAGADAILLIAKILSTEEIQNLLDYARNLNLQAVLEIADKSDLKKALQTDAPIIGINNRDLETFEINFGTTLKLAKLIDPPRTIISMSGFFGPEIRIVKGVADAVLIGTSVMSSANFQHKIQEFLQPRPLLKICGIRTEEDAKICEENGVNLAGLNFVPFSKRKIGLVQAQRIASHLKKTKTVGVFQDQSLTMINKYARILNLDFVQVHGDEDQSFYEKIKAPVIKALSINSEEDLQKVEQFEDCADLFILDGSTPGSGQIFDHKLLKNFQSKKPFLIAGGVNTSNAKAILDKVQPDGLDTASGAEECGKVSQAKIMELMEIIKN